MAETHAKQTDRPNESVALVHLDRARLELESARTIPDVIEIRDKAEAVRVYSKQIGCTLEIQNKAAEIKLRAERKAGELLREMEKAKGGRPAENRGHDVTTSSTLADLGIAKKESSRWQLEAAVPEADFQEHVEKCKKSGREITQAGLLKIAKTLKRTERLEKRKVPLSGDRFSLHHGDLVDVCAELEPGSIHAIITDPPYEEAALPEYEKLAAVADRMLVDGGHLVIMTGQAHLPRVFEALALDALSYQWTLGYFTPAASTQVWGRRVKSNWKPVLWYVKGKNVSEHISDVVKNDAADRRFHRWGQAVEGMAQIVERFTVEGESVLDPFLGGGSTALAAVQLKRKFIGMDIDEACVQKTAERLTEESNDDSAS